MQLTNPSVLWALVPAAIVLFALERRVPGSPVRRRWRFVLRLAVVAAALVALAQPYTASHAERARRLVTVVDGSAALDDAAREEARATALAARTMAADDDIGTTALTLDTSRPDLDLGSALGRAAIAFEDGELGSVLLMSAGRGPAEGVQSALERLRARGITVRAMPFPNAARRPAAQARIEALQVPTVARGPFVVRARAAAAATDPHRLQLIVDGQVKSSAEVSGANPETVFPALELPAGEHEIAIVLERVPPGGEAERVALERRIVTIGAPPRVLALLVDAERSLLRRALSAQGMEVVSVPPTGALGALTQGRAADLVILDPASAVRLPAEAQRALLQRVEAGLGVLLEAGDDEAAWETLAGTPLADALPLRPKVVEKPPVKEPDPPPPPPTPPPPPIDPPEDDDGPGIEAQRQPGKALPITVLLLVDRSASMHGEKLALALEGAVRAASQLSEWDRVGVITFADQATLDLPPRGARQAVELPLWRSSVVAGGGTDIFRALRLASQVLAKETNPIQHVILLTDGRTGGITLWSGVVGAMGRKGVTITAVGIGKDHSRRQLRDIIQWAARGSLISVYDAGELPTVMTKDTRGLAERRDEKAERLDRLQNPENQPTKERPETPEKPETPQPPPPPPNTPDKPGTPETPPEPAPSLEPLQILRRHEALSGFVAGDMPRVGPARASEPQLGALLLVAREPQEAVLAVRRYGLGRTAVWALPSDDPGAATWRELGRMLAQTSRAVMAAEGAFRFLPRVVVTPTPDGDRVHVEWPGGDETSVGLTWEGPGGRRVELGDVNPGDAEPVRDLPDPGRAAVCRIHVTLEDGRPVRPVSYLSRRPTTPGLAAGDRARLAALFGDAPADPIAVVRTVPHGTREERTPLTALFLWIAAGLLPFDVFAHRRGNG